LFSLLRSNILKKLNFVLLFIFAFALLGFSPSVSSAAQFDFYYQVVTDVEDLNTEISDNDSWWEKAKKTVNKGVNAVKRTWEKNVTRVYTLDEGDFKWYSSEDKNLVYKVKRVKVTDEAHLLQLMGVKNEDELSNGQKAMLEVYRSSKSDAIAERAQYDYNKRIGVILTDSTGIDLEYTASDGSKKTVSKEDYSHDFWSWSNGSTIHMATHNYTGSNAPENARSTFLHEYCHAIDRTIKEFIKPYGKDGSHYGSEKTNNRAAFVEGWAEYNEMLESESEARGYQSAMDPIMIELSDKEGEKALQDPNRKTYQNSKSVYEYVDPKTLSGEELFECEAYNANIMYRIATEIPDGRNKIYDAFKSTRWMLFRDLKTLVKRLCKDNPEDVAAIGKIVDELTYGKLSDKEMKKVIGNSDEAKAFLEQRAAGYPSTEEESEQKAAGTEIERTGSDASELTGTSKDSGSIFNIQ
jgi:hypothetical protein